MPIDRLLRSGAPLYTVDTALRVFDAATEIPGALAEVNALHAAGPPKVCNCVGNAISPLLSNIVLDELDWELDRRGHRSVRYADDCNVYVCSQRAAERVMASLTTFIERRLRLKVNEEKSAAAESSTRHFVGFTVRGRDDGKIAVQMSSRSWKRIRRRIVELTPRNWGGSLASCIANINRYLGGWMGFFHIVTKADFISLKILDSHIRRRLRAIVFRQKKRRRHMVTFLRKRRVPKKQVMRDIYWKHRSLWALSITKSAHKAMSSHWFDRQGLLRLVRLWRKHNPTPRPVIAPAQQTLVLG